MILNPEPCFGSKRVFRMWAGKWEGPWTWESVTSLPLCNLTLNLFSKALGYLDKTCKVRTGSRWEWGPGGIRTSQEAVTIGVPPPSLLRVTVLVASVSLATDHRWDALWRVRGDSSWRPLSEWEQQTALPSADWLLSCGQLLDFSKPFPHQQKGDTESPASFTTEPGRRPENTGIVPASQETGTDTSFLPSLLYQN